jgi:hypothetical protein
MWPFLAFGILIRMKRYRIIGFDFDTRVHFLTLKIEDHWDQAAKQTNLQAQQGIKTGLLAEFGCHQSDLKLQNFIDIGVKPFSIVAYHNKFLTQVRTAFVVGSYYPALTAACALGERILNHLMLLLRDDFRATPEYKRVYNKDSFDQWDLPIDTLAAWGVFLPETTKEFHNLKGLRNNAIHFRLETDKNDRSLALATIKSLQDIVVHQFAAGGLQPWFMKEAIGEMYLKNEWVRNPFVSKVYIPNCKLVGPKHWVVSADPPQFVIEDNSIYEDREITDEEFLQLRKIAIDDFFAEVKKAEKPTGS